MVILETHAKPDTMGKTNIHLPKLIQIFFLLVVSSLSISLLSPLKAEAAYPGHNGKISFTNADGNGKAQTYILDSDGSNIVALTSGDASGGSATWPNSGIGMVFGANRNGNLDIYKMNNDGSGQTQLTTLTSGQFVPRYSPDGSKIVYMSQEFGKNEVMIMNSDGSNPTRLTNNTVHEVTANWSPDGTRLCFVSSVDGDSEIYTMNPDGSDWQQLTNNSFSDTECDYSPDGSKILFVSNRDGNNEIYVMNTDGSNPARITNNANVDNQPAWSPDGTKIVFIRTISGINTIHIMNSDGSGIVSLGVVGVRPSWQPVIGTHAAQLDGSTTITVAANENYPLVNYEAADQQTLILDGSVCDVLIHSGGTLKGTGTACTITVSTGGTLSPGHSPGCLTSGNLTLSGTFTAELAGNVPCDNYDQLQINGTIDLSNATLNTVLLNGFIPTVNQSFTLIRNDGSDLVNGAFTNLPEGASFVVNGINFKISYVGGDGNDVVITALPGLPHTGYPQPATHYWLVYTGIAALIGLGGIRRRFMKKNYKLHAR